MKAVVMAGGEGSRLRPLTVGRPKPMVPIANKAVIGHILDLLKSHGFTEIVITLRYMAAAIQDFLDDGAAFGLKISYAVEEVPLGTAGSVKNAAAHLGNEPFLVISGDALTDFDLTAIIDAHRKAKADVTLTLARVPNPLEYGVIVTDEAGWVTQFLEKPTWGELLSDTVNTGIYIIEPDVLSAIPDDTYFDFSNDLFPLMMAEDRPIYGCIADGYWCDVGNMEEYMRANADLLYENVKLSQPLGTHIGGGVWVGENVDISPSAQIYGPVYLGNEVKIKGDVTIYGPTVIRDYSVIDNYSRIERSILWRNNYVGETCELRGVIVSRQCSIKSKVVAFEGVVIGEQCVLGEGAALHANVKLWPRKEIEAGATVRESIIWGNQGRRSLFTRFGVSGIVNIDLTAEFAAKLSAALGATLQKGSYVAIKNRDIHRASRMIKRALNSGLPGAGINVLDLGTIAVPVARHYVRNRDDTSAGIHVRLSPFDQRVVDIRFMDGEGMNQSSATERAIERTFFREDFRRAYFDEIGIIDYAFDPVERYTKDFLAHVDVEGVRTRKFKVVIDYSFGLASDTLSDIFSLLDVDVVPLNSRMDESKLAMLETEFINNRERMAKIVSALGADLGVQFDVGGEKIFIVDDKGRMLSDESAAALMMELALFAQPGLSVAVPITMPNLFETIAGWHDAGLIRVRKNLRSLMSIATHEGILLVIDGSGNFIFPDFQPAVDGMMASVRLLELLAKRGLPVSGVVDYLPPSNLIKIRVTCPWDAKGRVMRRINENYRVQDGDKIDGVKIHLEGNEWVHLLPNQERPEFVVRAEAATAAAAAELAERFRSEIESFVNASE